MRSDLSSDLSAAGGFVPDQGPVHYREYPLDSSRPEYPPDPWLAVQPPALRPGGWHSRPTQGVGCQLFMGYGVWTEESIP